ncbi:MAG: DUF3164 family protein [Spirochaetaceae bacterium]|nr:DUF3164 family protein [Spirochaetaceae bacterium]
MEIPEGYMIDSQGRLIPEEMVNEIDKLRDQTVRSIAEKAAAERERLAAFRREVMDEIRTFVGLSAERFGVQYGGKKGNVTLSTYDGRYKVLVAVNEHIYFDERLQVAKELIDECIKEWSEGARIEIQALVNDAFYVDKQGKINSNRILGLRRMAIEHPKWQRAMEAITESIQVSGSKEYIRVYERNDEGGYDQIALDVSNA